MESMEIAGKHWTVSNAGMVTVDAGDGGTTTVMQTFMTDGHRDITVFQLKVPGSYIWEVTAHHTSLYYGQVRSNGCEFWTHGHDGTRLDRGISYRTRGEALVRLVLATLDYV